MTPTIVYAPVPDDWRNYRAQVIDTAIAIAAAALQPVEMTLANGVRIIVQPSMFEQLRVELNRLLPECERQ